MKAGPSTSAPPASISSGSSTPKDPRNFAPCVDRVDCVGPPRPFSAPVLLQRLAARGIRLVIDGDGIAAEGDLDRLTDDDVAVIKAFKAQIMEWLHADAMTDSALEIFGGRIVAVPPAGLRCACGGKAWRPSPSARGRVYCLACHRGEAG